MFYILSTADSLALDLHAIDVARATETLSPWLWIAIVEAIIILVLLAILHYRSSTAYKQKQEILAETPDFGNILSSAFHAEQLYRDLIRKCHPDRYAPNQEKMVVANELAGQLSKYKHNLKELKRVEYEIQTRLNA